MSSSGPRPSTNQVPNLSRVDVRRVLTRLGDLTEEVVLVGGQAVNFWADYYAPRVPELARSGPFTSKDIDFCGEPKDVRLCALRLNGVYRLATMDDHTPNAGIVTFLDDAGIERVIDFIDQPHGLRAQDVHRTAQHAEILEDDGSSSGSFFVVMHPVLSMESRVHNTMGLPGYDTPHALKQLRASILCAREFLLDLLDANEVKAVLKLNERIFRFCHDDFDGHRVLARHQLDPFEAVVDDPRLPVAFREKRLPQMRERLASRRA